MERKVNFNYFPFTYIAVYFIFILLFKMNKVLVQITQKLKLNQK